MLSRFKCFLVVRCVHLIELWNHIHVHEPQEHHAVLILEKQGASKHCKTMCHLDRCVYVEVFLESKWMVKLKERGIPGWLSSLAPALARGVILGSQDPVPHRACFSLPMSLPLSLCLS